MPQLENALDEKKPWLTPKERGQLLDREVVGFLRSNPGKEHAVTGKTIAHVFGVSVKMVQASIGRLRKDGEPICANDNPDYPMGYYIPRTRSEADAFFASATNRAKGIFIMLRDLSRSLNDRFGTDYQLNWLKP